MDYMNTDIIYQETQEELDQLDKDISYFGFDGERHLIKVVKCYDGDTLYCIFKHNNKYQKFKIRMYGYDTPEMRPSRRIPEEERIIIKQNAKKARDRLQELASTKGAILICHGFDKYGRILGTVIIPDVEINDNKYVSVNDMMVKEGHGKEYFGGKK